MKKLRIHPCIGLYFHEIGPGFYLRKGQGQPVITCLENYFMNSFTHFPSSQIILLRCIPGLVLQGLNRW